MPSSQLYSLCLSPFSDGKLKEADQILAINGQVLDQTVTHQQAIGILQSASERVQLTVARGPIPQLASPGVSRTPSAASTLSANSSAVLICSHTPVVNEKWHFYAQALVLRTSSKHFSGNIQVHAWFTI